MNCNHRDIDYLYILKSHKDNEGSFQQLFPNKNCKEECFQQFYTAFKQTHDLLEYQFFILKNLKQPHQNDNSSTEEKQSTITINNVKQYLKDTHNPKNDILIRSSFHVDILDFPFAQDFVYKVNRLKMEKVKQQQEMKKSNKEPYSIPINDCIVPCDRHSNITFEDIYSINQENGDLDLLFPVANICNQRCYEKIVDSLNGALGLIRYEFYLFQRIREKRNQKLPIFKIAFLGLLFLIICILYIIE
ncbi:hypothetical protein CYY_001357 [Polysphondylium violaceum]|uniref:Transmembrane protein n=1 Tax=Polysphondylium violaceum TaxID=133409 RepID=A0A8J4VAP1_9MYCE|nr:hypothetical protein CYY_001357 [Polysphondylium violaceum]